MASTDGNHDGSVGTCCRGGAVAVRGAVVLGIAAVWGVAGCVWCPEGWVPRGWQCVLPCSGDGDCLQGEVCLEGVCRPSSGMTTADGGAAGTSTSLVVGSTSRAQDSSSHAAATSVSSSSSGDEATSGSGSGGSWTSSSVEEESSSAVETTSSSSASGSGSGTSGSASSAASGEASTSHDAGSSSSLDHGTSDTPVTSGLSSSSSSAPGASSAGPPGTWVSRHGAASGTTSLSLGWTTADHGVLVAATWERAVNGTAGWIRPSVRVDGSLLAAGLHQRFNPPPQGTLDGALVATAPLVPGDHVVEALERQEGDWLVQSMSLGVGLLHGVVGQARWTGTTTAATGLDLPRDAWVLVWGWAEGRGKATCGSACDAYLEVWLEVDGTVCGGGTHQRQRMATGNTLAATAACLLPVQAGSHDVAIRTADQRLTEMVSVVGAVAVDGWLAAGEVAGVGALTAVVEHDGDALLLLVAEMRGHAAGPQGFQRGLVYVDGVLCGGSFLQLVNLDAVVQDRLTVPCVVRSQGGSVLSMVPGKGVDTTLEATRMAYVALPILTP